SDAMSTFQRDDIERMAAHTDGFSLMTYDYSDPTRLAPIWLCRLTLTHSNLSDPVPTVQSIGCASVSRFSLRRNQVLYGRRSCWASTFTAMTTRSTAVAPSWAIGLQSICDSPCRSS